MVAAPSYSNVVGTMRPLRTTARERATSNAAGPAGPVPGSRSVHRAVAVSYSRVAFGVYRPTIIRARPGSNTIQVSDGLRRTLDRWSQAAPSHSHMSLVQV